MGAQGFGLFDPAQEKDSCGVGFIADIKGRQSHKLVQDALTILLNLEHRGAVGADPRAGDGAGILVQTPHKFLAKKAAEIGFALPPPGHYAVGALFMPHEEAWRQEIMDTYVAIAAQEGMKVLGWRDVPTDNSTLGELVKPTEPVHKQVFLARSPATRSEQDFERRLYILRKTISSTLYGRRERRLSHYYPVSISCRTLIYKGMFLADQLNTYYPDLHDPDFESALALMHQRFSTNTFPTWSLAHPYRMIAHNGEINTLRGNNNWMAARQASVSSPKFGADIKQAVADLLRRPVRHGLLRQRARIPDHGRLSARPRDDDDDTGGVGGQSADERGAPRLLRIQRRADGAVGRPGRDRLHQRPADRRDARPQRAAPGALHRHPRRTHHHGLGGRRAADPGRGDRHQVAAAAGQNAAGRSRRRPAHSRRGAQGDARAQPSLSGSGSTARRFKSRSCRRPRRPRRSPTWRCSIASRPSGTPRRT